MKLKTIFNYRIMAWAAAFVVASCAEDETGPVLPDSSAFVAPALTNSASNTPVVFTPETSSENFETFEWQKANYGAPVAATYVLQVDKNEDFSNPITLATTAKNTADVTVGKLNDAMLAMGLPTSETTVFLRVTSTINGFTTNEEKGYNNAPLISVPVERTATPYRISNCGNFCTVGIIGSASPGGWDVDTDLRLVNSQDKFSWTTTLYLTAGEVKFRASDAWDTNWGAATFPEGTGVANGANIPVANAGYYKVLFNDLTGAYSFTLLNTPEFTTVGIIGSGTPGGWDADTDLEKDPNNPHIWTGTVTLVNGEAKFRAENAWTTNWGGSTYPAGTGVQDGANIPVVAGTYQIRFNDATGEYYFNANNRGTPYDKLGLIGSATAGGWDTDTDLVRNPSNPLLWSKTIEITDGEAKFRADDGWSVNWGGSAFPAGIASQDGPNIPASAGKYFVTFNSGTGEYSFLK